MQSDVKYQPADELAALKSELLKMKRLIDSSLDIICTVDEAGNFLSMNAASVTLLGYLPEEMIGKSLYDFIVPEDYEATSAARKLLKQGINLTHFENTYIHKSGRHVPVSWAIRWNAAEQTCYCVARDTSERKTAEALVKAQEARYYRAYKMARIAWWEIDGKTHVATASDELFEMYGLAKPENRQMSRETYLSLIPLDEQEDVARQMALLFEKDSHQYEHHILKADGNQLLVRHQAELIKNADGEVLKIYGTAKDITQENNAQKLLEASEQQAAATARMLNELLDNLGDGFIAMDRNFTITYWNRTAEELLHASRQQMIGKNVWHLYPDAVDTIFYQEYHRAIKENVPVNFEAYVQTAGMWMEVSAYPSEGQLSVFFKNITGKRKREEALRISNERYELVTRATSDAIWDWDILSGSLNFNSSFTKNFGHPHTQLQIESGWNAKIHPDDRERVAKKMAMAHSDPSVSYWEDEYRFYRSDGTIAFVFDRGTIVRDEAGKAIRMIGAMSDLTRQKEAEAELKRLSMVVEETDSLIMITDVDERIVYVNKAFTTLTGYSLEEACGQKPGRLLQGPETDAAIRQYMKNCIEQLQPFDCEILNYTKRGQKFWVEIKGQPILNEQGKLQQYFSVQNDITGRKASEELIRHSEHRYKLLFHESPNPKYVFNAQTYSIVEANNATLQLYGYTLEEFTALTIPDLCLKEEVNIFYVWMKELQEQKKTSVNFTTNHVKKDGTVFHVEITSHIIELQGAIHVIAEVNDLTKMIELQRLVTEEKIAAQKEVMKAIIYTQEKERSEIGKELHDNVNQILTTAKLYIENIRYYPEQREAFIEKSASLVQKSINEIRALSKALVTPTINDIGFRETLEELVEQFRELALFKINFSFKASHQQIDRGIVLTVYRIVQEQLNNIVKYALASQVIVSVSVKGSQLVVRIEDDGVGFDTETKKTGLGLNNIRNRVGAYKGQVQLRSAVGKGCKLRVVFPL